MSAADIMALEPKKVKCYQHVTVDFHRAMIILDMTYGTVLETYFTNEDNVTVVETLFSKDRKEFKIIGRWRYGGDHHSMKWYARDSQFPLGSMVKL